MRLLIIGGGNMGSAVARGVISKGALPAASIGIVETDPARRELIGPLGCHVFDDCASARGHVEPTTQIMFAVKPQSFPMVAQDLHDAMMTGDRVYISIMAGLESARLHHRLGPGTRVIRCMPNTPCTIGRGMTAIALGMGAQAGDETLAQQIFTAIGRTVTVDESCMHAVTAVSGSGPAYVFLFAEAMLHAAEMIDLPRDIAKVLVSQTLVGAAEMIEGSNDDPAVLRAAVTSPGGTTSAALRVLQGRGFEQLVIDAVCAARDRGIALNHC